MAPTQGSSPRRLRRPTHQDNDNITVHYIPSLAPKGQESRAASGEKFTHSESGNSIRRLLDEAGIPFRRSGRHYRIQAVWRGGDGFNVSIDSLSGAWIDFAGGERGDLAELARRLGGALDPADLAGAAASQQAAQEDYQARRTASARRMYEQGISIPQARALAADPGAIRRGGAVGKRTRLRTERQQRAALAAEALEYLASRNMMRLAEKTPAKILLRPGFAERPWQILWPIAPAGGAAMEGVAQESGRGHENKLVCGRKQGRFFAAGPAEPQPEGQRTVAFFEGSATGGAIDAIAAGRFGLACLIDAGNLADLPRDLILKLPRSYDRAIVCGDHDTLKQNGKRPGNDAALRAARRIREALGAGFPVEIALPPEEGKDWADVLDQHGLEAAREIFQTARQPLPALAEGGEGAGAEVLPIQFWSGEPEPPDQIDSEALGAAQSKVESVVRRTLAAVHQGKHNAPTVIAADPGLGKTRAVTAALARQNQTPIIFLTPRVEGAAEAFAQIQQAGGEGGTSVHLHQPRSAGNCLKFEEVKDLSAAGRSSHAHLCLTCPHGKKELGADRCGYMRGISEGRRAFVVVATHAAGAEDSSLFGYGEGETISGEEFSARPQISGQNSALADMAVTAGS